MDTLLLYGFWISGLLVFYTYLGYGILMFIITRVRKTRRRLFYTADSKLPPVTMVIAAYNESAFIEEKICNTLELDYPKERLNVLVVTDGSTDDTPQLVSRFEGVRLFHQPERRGKIHAVNRVMKEVDTPIVVFSDANTLLNDQALKNIVKHYRDPDVGGVAGEKRIFKKMQDSAPGTGEGLYWKYESFLKKMDSDLYSIVGAAGELFSVRTDLFEPPAENMIIEDFYISMRIVAKGYRFVYEPDAYAVETAAASIADEWKRKVRIAAGGFQAIVRLLPLLNPLCYGVVSFQYVSHRVLRWTLAPLALLVILISNILLAAQNIFIYQYLLGCQLTFYSVALLGYLYRSRNVSVKGFFVPFYFTVMNLSVFAGFVRYLSGKQSVVWEKIRRAA